MKKERSDVSPNPEETQGQGREDCVMVFSSTLQIKKLQHYLKKYFTVFQELA
jgi:hypothetical protein